MDWALTPRLQPVSVHQHASASRELLEYENKEQVYNP